MVFPGFTYGLPGQIYSLRSLAVFCRTPGKALSPGSDSLCTALVYLTLSGETVTRTGTIYFQEKKSLVHQRFLLFLFFIFRDRVSL